MTWVVAEVHGTSRPCTSAWEVGTASTERGNALRVVVTGELAIAMTGGQHRDEVNMVLVPLPP